MVRLLLRCDSIMSRARPPFLEYGIRIGTGRLRGALFFSKKGVHDRLMPEAFSNAEQRGIVSGWLQGDVKPSACDAFLASLDHVPSGVPVYLIADISHAGVNWLSMLSDRCRARGFGANITCGMNDDWLERLSQLPNGKSWRRSATLDRDTSYRRKLDSAFDVKARLGRRSHRLLQSGRELHGESFMHFPYALAACNAVRSALGFKEQDARDFAS